MLYWVQTDGLPKSSPGSPQNVLTFQMRYSLLKGTLTGGEVTGLARSPDAALAPQWTAPSKASGPYVDALGFRGDYWKGDPFFNADQLTFVAPWWNDSKRDIWIREISVGPDGKTTTASTGSKGKPTPIAASPDCCPFQGPDPNSAIEGPAKP